MKAFKQFIIENLAPVDHLALHATAAHNGLRLPDVEYTQTEDGYRGSLPNGGHVSYKPAPRHLTGDGYHHRVTHTHPDKGIHREDGPAVEDGNGEGGYAAAYYKEGKQIARTDNRYVDKQMRHTNRQGIIISREDFLKHLEDHGLKE